MTDTAHADAVRALEVAFSDVLQEFRRVYAHMASAVSPGMLPPTLKVLISVSRCGSTTASELADRLSADKAQVSRSVNELEELGLIARTPDALDGRIKLISITEQGAERLAEARRPYEGRLGRTVADWPADRILQAAEFLAALVEPDPAPSSLPDSSS